MKYRVTYTVGSGVTPRDLMDPTETTRDSIGRFLRFFATYEYGGWEETEDGRHRAELLFDPGLLSPIVSMVSVSEMEAIWEEQLLEQTERAGIEFEDVDVTIRQGGQG